MAKKIVISVLLVMSMVLSAEAVDIVTFNSTSTTDDGKPLMLRGKLSKPQGDGPFPAVVLLHGASGINKFLDIWADRLVNWGYVCLLVDSLGPRGVSTLEDDAYLSIKYLGKRARDAHDAKSYLGTLPFVDHKRIAVIGWSHGGTVLLTMKRKIAKPFRAAIAFYPYCGSTSTDINAPLLILIGELDDWCPARLCTQEMAVKQKLKTGHEVILKVYPGAYHCFDWEGPDMTHKGHILRYNENATSDAIVQVKNFLAKHLQ